METKIQLKTTFLFLTVMIINLMAKAQNLNPKYEKMEVKINNTDTMVNGKAFKELSEDEKIVWRGKINPYIVNKEGAKNGATVRIYKRIMASNADSVETIIERQNSDKMWLRTKQDSLKSEVYFFRDSIKNTLRMRNNADDIDWKMVHPRRAPNTPMPPNFNTENENFKFLRPLKPNTKSFNYQTTDNDGFTTRLSFNIEEPTKTELKEMFKNSDLAINSANVSNLILAPNFDKGTVSLNFTTAAKASVLVKVLDNEGKLILNKKKTLSTPNFQEEFMMSKNGIYYLQISMGNQTYIRKIIKK